MPPIQDDQTHLDALFLAPEDDDDLLLLADEDEPDDDPLNLADDDDLHLLSEDEEDNNINIIADIEPNLETAGHLINLEAHKWKVLVVDDDKEVHTVTELALTGFQFAHKPLRLLSAFSAQEARELLQFHVDVAILLDVVMEEQNSGLQLVKHIREELKNHLTRIILRTGQPGEAPEQSVIINYDINDYKLKTELTRRRLLTTLVANLRSYHDLLTIEQYRLQAIKLTAIQHELNLAQQIQLNMLPSATPDWEPFDVVCYTEPAKEIGGDFYTYAHYHTHHTEPSGQPLNVTQQRFTLAVGDVSGKGMPAALLMAVSLVSFNAAIKRMQPLNKQIGEPNRAPYPIETVLRDLDETIAHYIGTSRQNCALTYLELTTAEIHGQREISMRTTSAGCIPPYIKRVDKSVQMCEVGGFPLGQGLAQVTDYIQMSTSLNAGDMVILVSDGVVEANDTDRRLFGFAQLEETIRTGPTHDSRAMLAHIQQALIQHCGSAEQHDDITMMIVRCR